MMMLHEAASEKATRAAATAEGETQREREGERKTGAGRTENNKNYATYFW